MRPRLISKKNKYQKGGETEISKPEANKPSIKKEVKKPQPNSKIIELVDRLFALRMATHLWHLQTKLHSEHQSLDGIYNEIVDLTDRFFEEYQGMYDRVKTSGVIKVPNLEDVKVSSYLRELQSFIGAYQDTLDERKNSHLVNVLDEIKSLISKTNYLLSLKG